MQALLDGDADVQADVAFLVFERARHSNGRDDAFFQPDPEHTAGAGAERCTRAGVRRLLVVVPHAPALLPHALKAGFASLAEGAVAALGFEQLVFLRAAQAGRGRPPRARCCSALPPGGWRQLQLDGAAARAAGARGGAGGAWRCSWRSCCPRPAPGTRVLPPETLWLAAQAGQAGAAEGWPLAAWLGTAIIGR